VVLQEVVDLVWELVEKVGVVRMVGVVAVVGEELVVVSVKVVGHLVVEVVVDL
jgi:hypothetical protein